LTYPIPAAWKPSADASARDPLHVDLSLVQNDLMSFHAASAKWRLALGVATDIKNDPSRHQFHGFACTYAQNMQPCHLVGGAPTGDGLEVGTELAFTVVVR